jgi:hypothetical protein
MNPRHPIYILSKGRPNCDASAALDHIGVPHNVVVEPQDEAAYRRQLGDGNLVVMDKNDQGVVYVRNFIWEHAKEAGSEYHWQLDDDIKSFQVLTHNLKIPVMSGTIFKLAEDWVDRFENIGQAAFQMTVFVPRKRAGNYPPIYLNTRAYSCTMNRTEMPFRYRGPLNDDTDMSLQVLKAGWCTVVFNAFLHEVPTTMIQKGGMTDLYVEDDGSNPNRIKMARKLVERHPDCTKVYWRWGRWQHLVDYRKFKGNRLRPKPGVYESLPPGFDEHGLVVEHLQDGRWERGHELPNL